MIDPQPEFDQIKSDARTALTNNVAYLAIASPTAAQVAAQVTALTRQTNGLIKVLLALYS